MELLPPAGDYLMGVSLVPHIPYNLVARGVEHIVEAERQLHRAEAGGEMSALLRHGVDDKLPDLLREKRHLVRGKHLEVVRAIYVFKQCHFDRP